ncbi:restriction endonuclease subunit S [Xanthomonas cannabis]|uniref:Type I restriction enzyme S subunit n=1 Tax=Xanthomonas cannabis TaxID=1885674 RepID=A0ABR6JJ36_9XANT|nr:restriction endonuclease subunit S [Xanthomonas cannabis]MBB4592828.1 type I restriction enzyme S subunit [Xanthomonas cannabis]MBB5520712.1 type I restriction enzyme S subunit [Xanthomonas cannabis]
MEFDLQTQTLADLSLDVSYGYTESAQVEPVGPRFLRITDIQNGVVDWPSVPYCKIDNRRLPNYLLQRGDIVVARTGNSTGENYIFDSSEQAVFASYLIRFRIDQNKANPLFVWYQLRTQRWWEFVAGSKTGSAQAGANAQVLGRFEIALPPRRDQDRIAAQLSTIDSKIAVNRRISQTLEAMAQATFRSWFVDFDPVKAKIAAKAEGRDPLRAAMTAISGKPDAELDSLPADQLAPLTVTAELFPEEMEDSKLGEIPIGWRATPLDIIANFLNGLALQKFPPESTRVYLPVIKIAQLRAGHTQGADRASKSIKEDYVVEDGDVLFSWSGSLEVDVWTGGPGALNQHLFKVTSEQHPKWFYLLATKHHLPGFREIAANKATTMGHIQRRHLSEAFVAVAPDFLMSRATELLGPIIKEIVALRLQSRELTVVRETLLPKLLSGDLVVPALSGAAVALEGE